MANYNSFMVTKRTFRVKDVDAFLAALRPYAGFAGFVRDGTGSSFTGLTVAVEFDKSIWLGGYDARLTAYGEDGDQIDLVPIIREHLAPGERAVLHTVGHEKLRHVTGEVIVITPERVLSTTLAALEEELLQTLAG